MRRLLVLPLFVAVLGAQSAPELVVSAGHAGPPSLAAFVGPYLATASSSTVALVDIATGLTVAHLPQPGLVTSLDAHPAGELLAVGTCGHSVQLWNVKSRQVVHSLTLKQDCPDSVSFSPDGVFLATSAYGCSCKDGGGIQVWNVRSAVLHRELATGSGVRGVLFGSNGRWLVGIDDKGTAMFFEWPSGGELQSLGGFTEMGATGSAMSSSPDGRYFAARGASELQVWDVEKWILVARLMPRAIAEFLNDGRLAYVTDEGLLRIHTLPDGPIKELPLEQPKVDYEGDLGITRNLSWLRMRRDGTLLAGVYETRTVLWNVATAKLRELTAPALTDSSALQWSRSGVIAWADIYSGVRTWTDRAGGPVNLGKEDLPASSLAFHPSGDRMVVSAWSKISIFDLTRRRSIHSVELSVSAPGTAVAYSPDGTRLAFASSNGFGIFDSALQQRLRLATEEGHASVEHAAFSSDGRWIAAGLRDRQPALKVWSSERASDPVTLDTHRLYYGPQPPAFSGDSRWLASFSKGHSVIVWTTGSWTHERTWSLPGTGRALAFAPSGARLAVAGDGEAAIWDATTGGKLVTLTSPGSAEATAIAWSPDGARVATLADDGVLRFWRASDGQLLASLYTLSSSRDWLLVAPNGRLDGTDRALSTLVAWRENDRVSRNRALTDRHRERGLWRSLSLGASRH